MISHFFDSVRMDGLFGEGQSAPDNPETDRAISRRWTRGPPPSATLDFSGLTLGEVREVAVIEGLPERFIQGLSIR